MTADLPVNRSLAGIFRRQRRLGLLGTLWSEEFLDQHPIFSRSNLLLARPILPSFSLFDAGDTTASEKKQHFQSVTIDRGLHSL